MTKILLAEGSIYPTVVLPLNKPAAAAAVIIFFWTKDNINYIKKGYSTLSMPTDCIFWTSLRVIK